MQPPDITVPSGPDIWFEECARILYDCASVCCKGNESASRYAGNTNTDRWIRIIETKDPRELWRAISWKGEIVSQQPLTTPPDEDFKAHFEELLNPGNTPRLEPSQFMTDITIPVLDDAISPLEVEEGIRKLKPNKACGPDGISPRLLHALPIQWILCITTMFNIMFQSYKYPVNWVFAKLCILYKKGNSMLCDNYRGISVSNSLAKLYDLILAKRLDLWFKPFREQAGAQKGRGCQEQLLTLRLLIEYAKSKKQKLYIIFIDFSKAYDRVPRHTLLQVLKRIGCGRVMLRALSTVYSTTKSILRTAIIDSTIGVRQGCPTSGILFILFLNELVKKFKEKCADDGYLKWLHCLLLMDDTVILATTKERAVEKFTIMDEYCKEYGMIINTKKTMYMIINGEDIEDTVMSINEHTIKRTKEYVYLGSIFTEDGKLSTSISRHIEEKTCNMLKLYSFIKRNSDAPFYVKNKVLEACLMSSILYSCEGWLTNNYGKLNSIYTAAIKAILGVRSTTPNILCFAEIGKPTLKALLQHRQYKFYNNMIEERTDAIDDPFMFVLNLVKTANIKCWKYIQTILEKGQDILESDKTLMKNSILNSTGTKYRTYSSINPEISVHPVYDNINNPIPEHYRQQFSRFRLSAHSLKVETGRWQRINYENRLCDCSNEYHYVQDEKHVIENCNHLSLLRDLFPSLSFNFENFMSQDPLLICKYIYVALSKLQHTK
jgi:hypothetical protein